MPLGADSRKAVHIMRGSPAPSHYVTGRKSRGGGGGSQPVLDLATSRGPRRGPFQGPTRLRRPAGDNLSAARTSGPDSPALKCRTRLGARFWAQGLLASWAAAAVLVAALALPVGAVPGLPANTGCDGLAVVAKLGVVEDRAAANMLAEALDSLTRSGRCLLDAGEALRDRIPEETRARAAYINHVYVVGGPAAISDAWVSQIFDAARLTRIAGGNRWETQAEVAQAIVSLTFGEPIQGYRGQSGSSAQLPPNSNCTQHAVLAKLTVVEDRAAANMLAEALDVLQTTSPSARCLIDVGDPRLNRSPSQQSVDEASLAVISYVVGGTTAIPNVWLVRHFGLSEAERVAGRDRWLTQKAVTALIIDAARSVGTTGHDAGGATNDNASGGGPSDD